MNLIKGFHAYKDCMREAFSSLRFRYLNRKDKWGHIGRNSIVHPPSKVAGRENIFLGDDVNIDWDNTIYAVHSKFEMGDHSGAAIGFTVITDNHVTDPGAFFKMGGNNNLLGSDVIVEEDVWIASNVTLLSGAHIGRGAIVGACCVVRNNKIPPYAIIAGNPCKIIGFRYTPEEIIEHEKSLYPLEKRIPLETLEKNYKKYYLDRQVEIRQYVRL